MGGLLPHIYVTPGNRTQIRFCTATGGQTRQKGAAAVGLPNFIGKMAAWESSGHSVRVAVRLSTSITEADMNAFITLFSEVSGVNCITSPGASRGSRPGS